MDGFLGTHVKGGGAVDCISDTVKSTYPAGTPSATECLVRADELFSTELWASLLGTHSAENITWVSVANEPVDCAVRDRPASLLD